MDKATLNVKLSPETVRSLEQLARTRGQSVDELVQAALVNCYQTDLLQLPQSQRRAVEGYLEGYLSIGKLAEKMGMHVLELRHWLAEHGLAQNSRFAEEDAANA